MHVLVQPDRVCRRAFAGDAVAAFATRDSRQTCRWEEGRRGRKSEDRGDLRTARRNVAEFIRDVTFRPQSENDIARMSN